MNNIITLHFLKIFLRNSDLLIPTQIILKIMLLLPLSQPNWSLKHIIDDSRKRKNS